MTNALFFLFSLISVALLAGFWRLESHQHLKRLRKIPIRIHVNGIRGKSTVTRLIAGVLRAANLNTVGKTTGSAACIIDSNGDDTSIFRRGAPTILEQIDFVKKLPKKLPRVDAIAIECMALKPNYQKVCETRIVQSNIGVLTNVRDDHQDVMGETLEEIAASLMNTCPQNGVLITAEQDPFLLNVIRSIAESNRTKVIVANPNSVSDEEVSHFDYVSFKENIAIGIAIAELLEIPRQIAMSGMITAAPDPGALRIHHREYRGKRITWANLFAVNDSQSVLKAMEPVLKFCTEETEVIGLLNNRSDREDRAIRFADFCSECGLFDRLALTGAFESLLSNRLKSTRHPFDDSKQIKLGEQRKLNLNQMLDRIVEKSESNHLLIVGLVNIHTDQAELLSHYFEKGE